MAWTPYDPDRGWQYSDYSTDQERDLRCQSILSDLAMNKINWLSASSDSRSIHLRMFDGMHPPGHEYFPGHYRGEPLGELATYNVGIGAHDVRVGYPYAAVAGAMHRFALSVASLPQVEAQIASIPDEYKKLVARVQIACAFLVEFLTIHPYADGNGHIGRFIVWAILHGFGLHPRSWPLNSRPQDPPYGPSLSEFRNGNPGPLVNFVLAHL